MPPTSPSCDALQVNAILLHIYPSWCFSHRCIRTIRYLQELNLHNKTLRRIYAIEAAEVYIMLQCHAGHQEFTHSFWGNGLLWPYFGDIGSYLMVIKMCSLRCPQAALLQGHEVVKDKILTWTECFVLWFFYLNRKWSLGFFLSATLLMSLIISWIWTCLDIHVMMELGEPDALND